MTAAVDIETPPAEMPEGAKPITLPVMVVEGMNTSDRRYIEPGALTTRTLPITLFAQTRSTHGADGDAATWVVGAITEAQRVPGPEVIQKTTGKPFPEGTYVWQGKGWMYPDVPAAPLKSAYEMLRDRALSGNSVDLSAVEAEFEFADDAQPGDAPERIVTYKAAIAATTLVGQPAFPDAYAEVDDMADELTDEAQAMVAAVTPAWLAAELGDECWTCRAAVTAAAVQDTVTDPREVGAVAAANALAALSGDVRNEHEMPAEEAYAELAVGDDLDAADMPNAQDYSTSGMIALVPSNPNMLRVPGGDSPAELHLTLAYLGDQVDEWEPEQAEAIHQLARAATDWNFQHALRVIEARENGEDAPTPENYRSPAQRGPLTGNVFSHAVFNPNGDNGHDPATVYLLDGTGDRQDIEWLAMDMQNGARTAIGSALFPKQHSPYVPHVTAGYGVPVDRLTYTGPVEFDRLRVAIGDDVIDYRLGGEGEGTLVASAATLPPREWFEDPKLTGPTALTVTDEGRVYGHLATWGTCHIGFQGQCVQPPRSRSGYAYFQVHQTRVRDADGNAHTIPVGVGTVGTGHAGIRDSATMAAAHYDNTGTAAFELAAGEDEYGIWVAGRLMPGLDEATEHKARGTVFSGDWRTVRGQLELVAALGVNTPGFPVPRARVAGGAPLALVAAGLVTAPTGGQPDGPFGQRQVLGVSDDEFASVVAWVNAQRLSEEQMRAALGIDEALGDVLPLSILDEADLLYALEADHPWFTTELASDEGTDENFSGVAVTAAGRKVLHLPPYIKRIEKHLEKKGMAKGRAIATAVNAAKKMCSTGDLNFPGSQQVNPGSRAEACAAVAQWKKDRPGAK